MKTYMNDFLTEEQERTALLKGEKIGMKKGEKIGEKKGEEKVAVNMLKKGLEINLIMDYTGISLERLSELNKRLIEQTN